MNGKMASLFRNGAIRRCASRGSLSFPAPARIRRLPNRNLEIELMTETGLLAAFKDEPPLPPRDWMDSVHKLPIDAVDL